MISDIIMREYSETIPVQYQDGFTVFMGLKIKVDPRVLIPRPETELLVRVAVETLNRAIPGESKIVDMCTGSGAVAISLAGLLPKAKITAVDISAKALEVASENINNTGFPERIDIVESDIFSGFSADHEGVYDGVVANPPYVSELDLEFLDPWVKAEPVVALFGGKDGIDHLAAICSQSPKFLKKGGFLAVEVGYDQSSAVKKKMAENGFSVIKSFKDHNGYDRVIRGFKNG
jgi:release factor glutamine methyltransferase